MQAAGVQVGGWGAGTPGMGEVFRAWNNSQLPSRGRKCAGGLSLEGGVKSTLGNGKKKKKKTLGNRGKESTADP